MASTDKPVRIADIGGMIRRIRGQRVILDSDLAAVYGADTKSLNRAVRRNRNRFPEDFIFQLSPDEFDALRCQFGTSKGRGGRRYLPYAFTEHGAIMAATVLNSARAVRMSVFVVRAFVQMRSLLTAQRDFAKKLAELERKLTERLDWHEHTISDIIQQIMLLLNPPAEPEPTRRGIGFQVREARVAYRVRRKAGRQ